MTQKLISMDRRDFIKKATMAAAGAAVVSPMSAMLDSVTGERIIFGFCVNLPSVLSVFRYYEYDRPDYRLQ